jgi:hypothetical protein
MEQNTIKLETAIEWAKNWREKQPDVVKAFLIPKEDIIELYNLIKDTEDTGVRGYLGIKDDGEYKLMLLVVDPTGNDDIESGIFDMTKPCPDTCDSNSPLYTLES